MQPGCPWGMLADVRHSHTPHLLQMMAVSSSHCLHTADPGEGYNAPGRGILPDGQALVNGLTNVKPDAV
jgi:hypothetical protein